MASLRIQAQYQDAKDADKEHPAQAKGEEDTGEEDLPATTPDETEETPLVFAETSPPEMEAAPAADAGNEAVPLRDPEAPALPAPRRMRFSFEG